MELLPNFLHVNEFVGGVNDMNEALEVYQKTKNIMSEEGFKCIERKNVQHS